MRQLPKRSRFVLPLSVFITLGLVLAACGSDGTTDSVGEVETSTDAEPGTPADEIPIDEVTYDPSLNYVAESKVQGDNVILDEPDGTETITLSNPNVSGAPLVFLTVGDPYLDPTWVEVYLPARPNGSTGWVPRDSVDLTTHDWRIQVDLSDFDLKVFKGDETFLDSTVAVASDNTPTPGGLYFTTVLIQPTNEKGDIDPDTVYGNWAYGLSGYSEMLETFNGGDGQLGIHGTNQPELLGQKVSHGCIRMHNDDIDQLAPILPLGVPVEVIA